jgi:hypothetical protein
LVYNAALGVLRKATNQEMIQIRADYEKQGKSAIGVFISFKQYLRSDMIKLYSALEYCTVAALHKSMNLSKAVQFKMSDLRATVGLKDSAETKTQAKAIANALSCGKDILLDAKDEIMTVTPDLTAVQSAMDFLNQKRSFYLGMPASYNTGEAPKGLGDSGEGDSRAVERGLKQYYFSVVKPVIEAVFEVKTTFKSQDFRQVSSGIEAMKTFEITSDELISKENKTSILNKLFDLDEDAKGDPAPALKTVNPANPAIPPPADKKPKE